jgi:hypothetical protein
MKIMIIITFYYYCTLNKADENNNKNVSLSLLLLDKCLLTCSLNSTSGNCEESTVTQI